MQAGGEDLGLDDARGAVVDGAEDRHRAPVLLRVTDEELAAGRLGCSLTESSRRARGRRPGTAAVAVDVGAGAGLAGERVRRRLRDRVAVGEAVEAKRDVARRAVDEDARVGQQAAARQQRR